MLIWDEDTTTYEEHLKLLKKSDFTSCRLIISKELEILWAEALPENSIIAYCEVQYDLLANMCKEVLLEGRKGSSKHLDYNEMFQRSYLALGNYLNAMRAHVTDAEKFYTFYGQVNERVVMNLYIEEIGAANNLRRTLVLMVDVVPADVHDTELKNAYDNHRHVYESHVNLLH